jgi:hypothetical protein
MKMKDGTVLRQIPKGVWVLGGVSMLMDISSEMVHSILPLFGGSISRQGGQARRRFRRRAELDGRADSFSAMR